MSEQPRLDVLGPQWLSQKGVVEQVYLAYRKIIGGAPISVDQVEIAVIGSAIVGAGRSHLTPSG